MFNTMTRHRAKRADGDRGFTLIELLVVVVIIGILIAIAVPLYLNYRKGANDKAAQSDLRSAISVLEQCNSDNATYPTADVTKAAATTPSTVTACTGQTINFSANTAYSYTAPTPTVSFKAVTSNTAGGPRFYCYNSATGGSVRDITSSSVNTMALALAACS